MKNAEDSIRPEMDGARRRFVICMSTAAGAVALGGTLARIARAAELPHVAADDPTAKNLYYTEDASKAGPPHQTGQQCVNCTFFSGGNAAYGPCPLFPGKAVNSKGWCSAYAKAA